MDSMMNCLELCHMFVRNKELIHGNVLLVLGIIILIAAIVSPLSIIIGGVIGIAMIIAGIVLRKKNTNSKG